VKVIVALLNADEGKPPEERMTPAQRREMEKNERYYAEEIKDMYGRVLGCEKPKLQSIEVRGDPRNPLNMSIDLSGLPDEDLNDLARILPKLGGAIGPDAAPRLNAPSGSGRATPPQGGSRTGRNRS
jgi:hypothetical protein